MSAVELTGCLDDLEAFALVNGTCSTDRLPRVLAHVEACASCHELVEGLCEPDEPRGRGRDGMTTDALIGLSAGAYTITSVLAGGGMGQVYRAHDRARDCEVALKIPRSNGAWIVRRFEREIAITARLTHPGVVPFYDRGALDDGTPFLVMQLVEGISLERAIASSSNRKQRLALVDHLVAVAATMTAVHDAGIAHRDLKPHNILVGSGATVVLDWGLAKELGRPAPRLPRALAAAPLARSAIGSVASLIAGRTTRPGDVLGTPAFMPPEQARGEEVDHRADIFAIGAMLEHLLVGSLPSKAAEAALNHAPQPLVAVCRKAMAADRGERYATAGELMAALRAALAPPPSAPPPPSTWRKLLGRS